MNDITFFFGHEYPELEHQANVQGYTLGKRSGELQELCNAMLKCFTYELCNDAQKKSLSQKMRRRVMRSISPLNERDRI